MQTFTAWQYLLIDAANCFGHDKLTFEERIKWAEENLHCLEELAGEVVESFDLEDEDLEGMDLPMERAESPYLFRKAVMAIRKAQRGEPTGHLVAFDACCSGLQIMSALTGCLNGARATGMIDPDVRADAYTEGQERMSRILGGRIEVLRARIKKAIMTMVYGSKAKPRELFGVDTPELTAFYQAVHEMAPGACELLQVLLDSWNPWALEHSWVLPDGYVAKVKVMQSKEERIEVDELGGASFTYIYEVNEGTERGLSNVANVIHSIDAYVLRCLLRRCNYDPLVVQEASWVIEAELLERSMDMGEAIPLSPDSHQEIFYYLDQYNRSGMADTVILPYLDPVTVRVVSDKHLRQLKRLVNTMLEYKPFPVVTIHDSFASHPNNVNWVRHWYKELMAELNESNILDDILSQLFGVKGHFQKKSKNLADKIRNSNYALS